jgi:hypothetical protein
VQYHLYRVLVLLCLDLGNSYYLTCEPLVTGVSGTRNIGVSPTAINIP